MLARPRGAVQRQTGTTETLYLYEAIGADWFGDGITAANIVPWLGNLQGVAALDVRINSAGGDVFDGLAIFNALRRLSEQGVTVTTYIDGMAWSIASVIAMAGDVVHIASNAQYMIHNPAAIAYADADELRKLADTLDATKDSLIDAYQLHTAAGKQKLSDWMDAETWFTATQTVDAGFADTVDEALPIAACYPRNMRFRNMPKWVKPAAAARPHYERRIAAVRERQRNFIERRRAVTK
jgi:ATP-dependent Clp protease protease subunit